MPRPDAWVFSVPTTSLPREQVHVPLGILPAGDYWAVATASVSWSDTFGASYFRHIDAVVDVDGYDMNGNPTDWESGIGLGRLLVNYQANGEHQETRDLVGQSVFTIPSGGLVLNVGLADQGDEIEDSVTSLVGFQLVVIEVKPR